FKKNCRVAGVVRDVKSGFPLLAADCLLVAAKSLSCFAPRACSSKNRVSGFRLCASGRFSRPTKQSPGFTQRWRTCPYKTASGRREWPNRDPVREYGFELLRKKKWGRPERTSNLYVFIRNSPPNNFDSHGLSGRPVWPEQVDCTPAELDQCESDCWPYGADPVCYDILAEVPGDPGNPDIIGHGCWCNCRKPPPHRDPDPV